MSPQKPQTTDKTNDTFLRRASVEDMSAESLAADRKAKIELITRLHSKGKKISDGSSTIIFSETDERILDKAWAEENART